MDEFSVEFDRRGWNAVLPPMVQVMSEEELVRVLPEVDGWIAGDDPVSRKVLEAGRRGRLRAVVKWGVGTDNVDFTAARTLEIPISNTPGMFSEEVADVAVGYTVALARETHRVDRGVRSGGWPKPSGISLKGKRVALVGLGSVGRQIARRLDFVGMHVTGYDPGVKEEVHGVTERKLWPDGLGQADFIILACPLTPETRGMVNEKTIAQCKEGVRLVNVARGGLVSEPALIAALQAGHVHSAALDVFEQEPPKEENALLRLEQVVLGSHNASNTKEATRAASEAAINVLGRLLDSKVSV